MKTFRVVISLALLSPVALAHDLYLTVQGKQVCAGIGEQFPASMNAVTPDRVGSFTSRTSQGQNKLAGKVQGKQFCAPAGAEPFIAEMTIPPRFIRIDGKNFTSYIHGEGLNKVEASRSAAGQSDADGRELYSRYTKLLRGRLGDAAIKPLGHALEIVPERDPAELKAGEVLRVQVLFRGKPLADVQVSAVYANAKLAGHEYPVTTRTDSQGKADLKLDRVGLWYARMIYMEPGQNDPDFEWRSYFATMTFEVGGSVGQPTKGVQR